MNKYQKLQVNTYKKLKRVLMTGINIHVGTLKEFKIAYSKYDFNKLYEFKEWLKKSEN